MQTNSFRQLPMQFGAETVELPQAVIAEARRLLAELLLTIGRDQAQEEGGKVERQDSTDAS